MSSDANQWRALNVFPGRERVRSSVTPAKAPAPPARVADDLFGLSDEALVDLLKAGSPDPIDILFARYRQLIFGICIKILRDASESEDVMQDIFLEVWEKAARFDSTRGTVKVWLIQFAYSRSLNRRREIMVRRGNGLETNGAVHREIEPSYVPDTVEKLTIQKQLDRITEAFDGLSRKQKEALRLVYFEGLSIKEVADQMREAVENVRHHYYRGLKRLREVLAGSPASDAK